MYARTNEEINGHTQGSSFPLRLFGAVVATNAVFCKSDTNRSFCLYFNFFSATAHPNNVNCVSLSLSTHLSPLNSTWSVKEFKRTTEGSSGMKNRSQFHRTTPGRK